MAWLLGRLTTGIRGSFLFMFTPTSVLFRARHTMRICGDDLAQYFNNPSNSTYRLGRYLEYIPSDCTIQAGTCEDLAYSLVLSYCSVHSVSSVHQQSDVKQEIVRSSTSVLAMLLSSANEHIITIPYSNLVSPYMSVSVPLDQLLRE